MQSMVGASLLPPSRPRSEPAHVVALGGDGVGPEVIDAALRCLAKLSLPIHISRPEHGAEAVRLGKPPFPPEARQLCDEADAVLFGACERDSVEILEFLRFGRGCYANVRPVRTLAGVPLRCGCRPAGFNVDLVVVREATEGLYPGREGDLAEVLALPSRRQWRTWSPGRGRYAVRVITERACERIALYAVQLARERKRRGGRGHVTIVTKSNVLRQTDGLFRAISEAEAKKAPEITFDHLYVDEAARRLVACPDTFDVIVTSNLYGDILSDVAAEAMGGLALAPSACIGDDHAYFEPVHGSAPDLAGTQRCNPSGAILSTAMMLVHLGFAEAAGRLEGALCAALSAGAGTADLGRGDSTVQLTEATCTYL